MVDYIPSRQEMITHDKYFNKARIAPTPSGFLHVGNILSFSITAAVARKTGAKILLRIDDIDQARANKQYIQDIFDTLNFLEIPWDEGPRNVKEFEDSYSQVHRLGLYNEAFERLRGNGAVYACTCSRSQLNTSVCNCKNKVLTDDIINASWRLDTSGNLPLSVKSYNGETVTAASPAEMENFVIKRKDGLPAYQLTSVIDDLFYGVDLVVRGEDLWPSTLAQHQLSLALGEEIFAEIAFYHHPLLMEAPGKKLSKSAGSTSINYLRAQGKKPADIFVLIAGMLGIKETVVNWEQLAGQIL
ncbi:glutamate--tRNA ligase family protein [Mucilaginibacter flavidus]|uniref:glutamate--tRNA ligase family protein n=1 Tax=Mucilaginibacter flavidus TaxID=2949309 RepID=UPI002093E553|nr:glutamate--tRNA ligase family protein [Mucilaginibacter flavidus]